MSCETCRWWAADGAQISAECHGSTPTFDTLNGRQFPVTHALDYCKAWEARAKAQPEPQPNESERY